MRTLGQIQVIENNLTKICCTYDAGLIGQPKRITKICVKEIQNFLRIFFVKYNVCEYCQPFFFGKITSVIKT